MNARISRGTSLLEVMIGMALMLMLLSVYHPLNQLRERSQQQNYARALTLIIHEARTASLARLQPVTVCPVRENACQENWNRPISSFIDGNKNRRLDPDETQLNHLEPNHNILLNWRSMTPSWIGFDYRGYSPISNGTMTLCQSRTPTPVVTLVINRQGRVRTAPQATSSCEPLVP